MHLEDMMWSFTDLGCGTVVSFDSQSGIGSITDKNKRVYRFDRQDGRLTIIDKRIYGVVFSDVIVPYSPKIDDELIFRTDEAGSKALVWAFHDQWAAIRDALPQYRLRKVRDDGSFFGDRDVAWWWINVCAITPERDLSFSDARQRDKYMAEQRLELEKILVTNQDEYGSYRIQWEVALGGTNLSSGISHANDSCWQPCDDPRLNR